MESIREFADAMSDADVPCADPIEPDGQIHRYHVKDDRIETKNGWYVFHANGVAAGCFGSWKTGLTQTWREKTEEEMTEDEKWIQTEREKEAKLKRQQEQIKVNQEAKTRANEIWRGLNPAKEDHHYLKQKGVKSYAIRQQNQKLVIPVRDSNGDISSLQFIQPDGQKRFLTGGKIKGSYHAIGNVDSCIYICEGYATAATIHLATGDAVAVAFDAGNLKSVASAIRAKYPDISLIIAADNDQWVEGNPGLTKACEAAREVNAKVIHPKFKDTTTKPTDWNDLQNLEGLEMVQKQLNEKIDTNKDEAKSTDKHFTQAQIIRASDVQPEAIQWLWPGRIALGKVSLLAGDPGLGKSLLTIAMATHVTRGTPWPVDKSPCPQGEVILLSAEDDLADTIRPRLDASGADCTKVHILTMIYEDDPDTGESFYRTFSLKRDIPILETEIALRPDTRLVVIDPLSAYLSDTDSHKNSDIRGLLVPLADMAARYRVAIVSVTHLNKSGNQGALYRAMGSLAFVAAARSVLMVTKDKDDPQRRLVIPAKNNLAPDATGLAYSIAQADNGTAMLMWEPDPVTVTADEALTVEPEDVRSEREEAIDWLRGVLADGPVPAKDLKRWVEQAGHAWRTVRRAQKTLGVITQKQGFAKDSHWTWELPKVAKDPEDVQSNNVDTFDESGHLRNTDTHDGQITQDSASGENGLTGNTEEILNL